MHVTLEAPALAATASAAVMALPAALAGVVIACAGVLTFFTWKMRKHREEELAQRAADKAVHEVLKRVGR